MITVYKEYEVEIKMVQEQLLFCVCVEGGEINLWWGNGNLVGSQLGGGIFLGGRNEQILGWFGEISLIPKYGKPCYHDFSVKYPRYWQFLSRDSADQRIL